MTRERFSLLAVAIAIILGVAAMVYLQGNSSSDDLDVNTPSVDDSGTKIETSRTVDGATSSKKAETRLEGEHEPDAGPKLEAPRADCANVYGVVMDQKKVPVAGAVVALCLDISDFRSLGRVGKVIEFVETDKLGQFALPNVHVGEVYSLRVECENFASRYVTSLNLVAGSSKRYEVTLVAGITIKGKVMDLSDQPVAGARVFVVNRGMQMTDKEGGVERETTSGPDGRFLIKHLTQGFKSIGASKAQYATRLQHNFHVHPSQAKHDVVLKLGPGKALSGLVVDDHDVPVNGVEVTAQSIDLRSSRMEKNYQTVRSNEQGRFFFAGLKAGDYYLTTKKLGYYPALSRNLARPGGSEQTIRLKRNPVLRGHVVDAQTSEPVTEFTLYSTPRKSILFVSDNAKQHFKSEDGSFEFLCLRNKGDVFLHLEAPKHAAGTSDKIVLNQQELIDGIVVHAIAGATAVGRVVNIEGQPISGAHVEMETVPDGSEGLGKLGTMVYGKLALLQRKVTTGKDGRFRISRLRPANYRLVVKHGSHALKRADQLHIVKKDGEFSVGDVVLTKGGTLSGVVFDRDNSTMAGVLVKVVPEDASLTGAFDLETKTDKEGHFILRHLPAGGYKLQVIRTARLAQIVGDLPNVPTARFMSVFVGEGEDKKIEVRGL